MHDPHELEWYRMWSEDKERAGQVLVWKPERGEEAEEII
jgi:hypothetical protein